jgi:hypothetical protein
VILSQDDSTALIAEGWGLRPELVAPIIDSPDRMVVMVATFRPVPVLTCSTEWPGSGEAGQPGPVQHLRRQLSSVSHSLAVWVWT